MKNIRPPEYLSRTKGATPYFLCSAFKAGHIWRQPDESEVCPPSANK